MSLLSISKGEYIMKSAYGFGVFVAISAFASFGLCSNAYAVNANHSGTVCKNYNASQVTDIDYLPNGTRNLNASARYVICPITRSPTSTNQVSVYIDGFASSGNTVSCTLYSYDYNGTFLGSQSFPTPRTGTFDQHLAVAGSYWGNASVLCLLPGNAGGIIYGVEVVQ